MSEVGAKLLAPAAHRLVAHDNATFKQQLFDVAQAQLNLCARPSNLTMPLEDLFGEIDAENIDFHDEPPHVRLTSVGVSRMEVSDPSH